MRLWLRKQKTPPPVEKPAPKVLTGIEKHWLEEDARARAEAAKELAAKQEKIRARIAEIEKKIDPELSELRQLRSELDLQAKMGLMPLTLHDGGLYVALQQQAGVAQGYCGLGYSQSQSNFLHNVIMGITKSLV